MLCLGDLVGYGADPLACVEPLGERADAIVAGNHEHARRRPPATSTGSTRSRARRRTGRASAWTRDHRAYLARCRSRARSTTPRWCTPRRRSRTSGTISSRPRTGSRSSATSPRGSASSATRTCRASWSLGSTRARRTRRLAPARVRARATAGATSSTWAAWASRATAIRARPTALWDREARRSSIRRVAYDLDAARRKILARRAAARSWPIGWRAGA